jgi:hypothetical protein
MLIVSCYSISEDKEKSEEERGNKPDTTHKSNVNSKDSQDDYYDRESDSGKKK